MKSSHIILHKYINRKRYACFRKEIGPKEISFKFSFYHNSFPCHSHTDKWEEGLITYFPDQLTYAKI
jgi:hypothetical protein